jgi:hypothetical protein
LSGSVPDCLDQQADDVIVDAGDCLAEADRDVVGEAGRKAEHASFPA